VYFVRIEDTGAGGSRLIPAQPGTVSGRRKTGFYSPKIFRHFQFLSLSFPNLENAAPPNKIPRKIRGIFMFFA
jgi:hypothetical protein